MLPKARELGWKEALLTVSVVGAVGPTVFVSVATPAGLIEIAPAGEGT